MTQYDNNMRGILGRNERREKDSQPEFTGRCEIDGKEFWISAWVKESAKGKFFSLSFKPKEEQQAKQAPRRQREEDSDPIPF
jgi:hypothetical protein